MNFTTFFFVTITTLVLILVTSSEGRGKRARARDMYRNQNDEFVPDETSYSHRRSHKKKASDKPNIVIIMTDDQDKELGSMNFMPKTLKIMSKGGATFNNAFVTTPMCCPSRSSFLTGMYPHNHNVYTNNDNCSSIQWQQTHETRNFATYLSNAGYRTGYFGKYLNEYNGTYIPPGWREWVGLIRNSRFYNYMINFNGQKIRHMNDYYKDYFTDLIANDSVTFLKQSKRYFPNRPVAMVLSMPAPHGPEDAAPQYQHLFENVTVHRTPSWNYAPNPDKQWLLQYTGKMEPIHIAFTDILMRKRLQTLQSVDDAVEKVYSELKALGELDNTYIIYTSDHGYHLGQYGLIKGKAMPYDFDIKVPFYVRGPGIEGGMTLNDILTNVDVAPTILEMAGINVPDHIDGKSFYKLLLSKNPKSSSNFSPQWRDTVLVERGKINGRNVKQREQIEYHNVPGLRKEARIAKECQNPAYKAPCKPKQKWVCTQMADGRWRKTKCRLSDVVKEEKKSKCVCPPKKMRKDERRNQKQFLKNFVNQPSMLTGTKFIKNRSGRSVDNVVLLDESDHKVADQAVSTLETVVTHYVQKRRAQRRRNKMNENWNFGVQSDRPEDSINYQTLCTVTENNTVACDRSIYSSKEMWKIHKDEVNKLIEHYKEKINMLKEIREHLRIGKPAETTPIFGVTKENGGQDLIPTTLESFPDFSDNSEDTAPGAPRNHIQSTDLPPDGDTDASASSVAVGKGEDCVCEDESFNESVDIIENTVVPRPSRKEKKERKRNKKNNKKHRKRKNKDVTRDCHQLSMKCFTHDNDHWQTPPLWNLGPFCFCPNSNNNTYWCIRTINNTHNFLYCEFITGFISYYDFLRDPYQLRNAVHDLEYWTLQIYHQTLNKLRACKGSKECTVRSGSYSERKEKTGRHGRRPPSTSQFLL